MSKINLDEILPEDGEISFTIEEKTYDIPQRLTKSMGEYPPVSA